MVRERWLGPERFVRVTWNSKRSFPVAIEIFTPDPRKKQYYKPKWWCRSASYGSIEHMRDEWLWRKDMPVINEILDEIESLNGISSDRRAAAS